MAERFSLQNRGAALAIVVLALAAPAPLLAAGLAPHIPKWLMSHVGESEGQIAQPVLERARDLYLQKRGAGAVRNACYFAMDATRPNEAADGAADGRFYIICEAEQSVRAISAGHGGGRNLGGVADFHNERLCARNFSNAMGSNLTAGGAYVTGEARATFKGFYRPTAREEAPFVRTFIQFNGEGETDNARERAIGGHAALGLKGVCRRRAPQSPYADPEGYVPLGNLVDYTGGRSDGCTSWSGPETEKILSLVNNDPTTLYIYPASADVEAVERALRAGRSLANEGLYWNAACLKEIDAPRFWPKQVLEPLIAKYEAEHPSPPPKPAPVCAEAATAPETRRRQN